MPTQSYDSTENFINIAHWLLRLFNKGTIQTIQKIILLYHLAVYCFTYFTWYRHFEYVLSIAAFMYTIYDMFSFFILLVPNSNGGPGPPCGIQVYDVRTGQVLGTKHCHRDRFFVGPGGGLADRKRCIDTGTIDM